MPARKRYLILAICGMQCAVIEYARNVCGLKARALSLTLIQKDPVIYLMERWFDFRKGRVEERTNASEKGGDHEARRISLCT